MALTTPWQTILRRSIRTDTDSLMSRDLHLALVGASMALSLAVSVHAMRETRWSRSTRTLIVALACCGLFYSLLPQPLGEEWPRAWRVLWRALAAPGVLLLWLTLRALFSDVFAWRVWHLAAGAMLCGCMGLSWLDGETPGPWSKLGGLMLAAAALGFIGHGLWDLWAGRRDDLEASRRPLRVLLGVAGAMAVLLTLAGVAWRLPTRWPGFGTGLLTLQSAAKLAWLWFAARPADPVARWLSPLPPLPASASSTPPQAQKALELLQTMRDQRLYQRAGLTINQLANELRLPEHRLRQLINQQLGFRNFNAFLNQLRLEDVARRLQDPHEGAVAITTVALDAGYASLGPFNRAFREAYGVTPTEFRRQGGALPRADS